MGDDLIESRYEIYGSTKSSYSRETTYTLLAGEAPAEQVPAIAEEEEEKKTQEEARGEEVREERGEAGEEEGEAREDGGEEEDYEDPGYEKIRSGEEAARREEEDSYEVVAKVAQEVSLVRDSPGDSLTDSIEPADLSPDSIEPDLVSADHSTEYELVAAPQIRPLQPPPPRPDKLSVVEKVNEINKRNLRASQSLELLSNRLFTKRSSEADSDAGKEPAAEEPRESYGEEEERPLLRKTIFRSADSAVDRTFLEEEYSYEPELKTSCSKVVLRTRSLVSLEEEQGARTGLARSKITTGPDGTFRIGGRKADSELNLSDESDPGGEERPAYVSGEQLRKRKQEIFREQPLERPEIDKYFREINGDSAVTTKERALDNLNKYLRENNIALSELLINNNIVIIEPYRNQDRDMSGYKSAKEDKCRIAGAKVKAQQENGKQESNTLPRACKPYQPTVQRHFFYRCFKTNRKYVDDDLPDPDKVKYARELFQKVGKYAAPEDTVLMLPIAAKMYKRDDSKPRTTPEVRVVEVGARKEPQRKWTDTGSQSSGVSSDMSEECREAFSDEEPEREETTGFEAQPVSAEVLDKIRACGTSVTYYGGRVISHTDGPVRSPMTMTILDEIRAGQRRPSQDYLGVKFRLVKSNSCGSRLELAGTRPPRPRADPLGGRSLGQELSEARKRNPSWRELVEARRRAQALDSSHPEMHFEHFQVLDQP